MPATMALEVFLNILYTLLSAFCNREVSFLNIHILLFVISSFPLCCGRHAAAFSHGENVTFILPERIVKK